MADQDRPVHAVYDCATGEQTDVPYSDAEWEEHKARIVADCEQRAADVAEAAELAALVAAEQSPLVLRLARMAGIG